MFQMFQNVLTSMLGPVHTAPFLLVSAFVVSKLPVRIAPFLCKNGGKTSVFFIHIDPLDNKNAVKHICFVRLPCSAFVKPVVDY